MKKTKIAAYTGSIVLASAFAVAGWTSASVRAEVEDSETPQDVVKIDEKNFPDKIFREYVSETFDTNGDGELSKKEIEAARMVEVPDLSVTSLKGIEFFTNMDYLNAYTTNGSLTELDVSKNVNLVTLDCSGHLLTSLDVSHNPNLESLNISMNYIDKIDISHNPKLKYFVAYESKLMELDTSKNTCLESLEVMNTKLRELDLSNNKQLTSLNCSQCYFTKIDVSMCPDLSWLQCAENQLRSLDLSKNTKLEYLYCAKNEMKSLDLSQCTQLTYINCESCGLEELKLGSISILQYFDAGFNHLTSFDMQNAKELISFSCTFNPLTELQLNCPKLENLLAYYIYLPALDLRNCPKILQFLKDPTLSVDDTMGFVQYFTAEQWRFLAVDRGTELITEDGIKITEKIFPDKEFREYVSKKIDRNADGMLSKGEIDKVTALDMEGTKAASLQGMELFPNLTSINCEGPKGGGNLTSIDVSWIPELLYLNCGNQPIQSLNVAENTKLRILYCNDTKIASLDLKANIELRQLHIQHTGLTSVDLDNCSYLVDYITRDDVKVEKVDDYLVIVGSDGDQHLAFDPTTKILGVDGLPEIPNDPTIADFVERLYTVALGRASEEQGKQYWVNEIKAGRKTGGDCGVFFLTGEEFTNRNLSAEDFVETLYKTFFGRESEPNGKAYWVGQLKNGVSRDSVVRGFIDSKEWCNLCADYGVRSGAPSAKAERASKNAIAFATRLYTCCLGRDAEQKGLAYWSLALTNLEQTGCSAAKEFFNSQEFVNLNLKNEEFVRRLYTTFMDREPEASEVSYWAGEIAKGAQTRASVLAFFGQSEEFTNICSKYGIERGTI